MAGSALYVVGRFEQAATLGTSTLSTAGGALAYVAKLLDAGTTSSVSWVQTPAGAASSMYAGAVAVVGSNVYVSGDFTGTVAFGTQALTSAGNRDVFVTKLLDSGSAGAFVWTQAAGGTADDLAPGLAVAGTSLYVAGTFVSSTASFGTTTLTSAGRADIFVARLIDSGPSATFAWAQRAGGPGNDSGYEIALSADKPVVVGSFNATASFGTQAITNAALYSENAYLAVLGPSVLATSAGAAAAGRLYPNPAHGSATVAMPAGPGPATLTLLDALGRVVRTQSAATGHDYSLDLAGLTPGVYALRVQAGAAVATQQLVVE